MFLSHVQINRSPSRRWVCRWHAKLWRISQNVHLHVPYRVGGLDSSELYWENGFVSLLLTTGKHISQRIYCHILVKMNNEGLSLVFKKIMQNYGMSLLFKQLFVSSISLEIYMSLQICRMSLLFLNNFLSAVFLSKYIRRCKLFHFSTFHKHLSHTCVRGILLRGKSGDKRNYLRQKWLLKANAWKDFWKGPKM